MCLAEEILEEVQRLFAISEDQKTLPLHRSNRNPICSKSQDSGTPYHRTISIEVVNSDPNDNMVVACALKARADYIVTRDNDLLSLENYENIKVVTPENFMGILRGGKHQPLS